MSKPFTQFCLGWDSDQESLESEATAQPNAPQPEPVFELL